MSSFTNDKIAINRRERGPAVGKHRPDVPSDEKQPKSACGELDCEPPSGAKDRHERLDHAFTQTSSVAPCAAVSPLTAHRALP